MITFPTTPTIVGQASFVSGSTYAIKTVGTTNWTSIGASADTIGTIFVYNGDPVAGSGGDAWGTFSVDGKTWIWTGSKWQLVPLGTASTRNVPSSGDAASAQVVLGSDTRLTGAMSVLATGSSTSRTLANRFADVVNVLDFGAVGDGVVDDTDKIQNAFNAGKYIYIPSGTYLVTKTKLEALNDYGLKPQNGSTIIFSKGATIKLQPEVDVRHIIAGINVNDVELVSCNIDGNNSTCNGIGFSGAKNFRVTGGLIKNIKSTAQSTTTTVGFGGGRAITFQSNCQNIVVDGVQFDNCFTCVDLNGKISGPTRAAVISNIVAQNCNVICTALSTDSTGLESDIAKINTTQLVINGVSFYNCGSSTGLDNRVNFNFTRQNSVGNELPWMSPARTGTSFSSQNWLMGTYSSSASEWNPESIYGIGDVVKYTNAGLNSCLFAIDQSSGVSISSVRGYNDLSYGKIGSIVRGIMKNVSVDNIVVSVDSEYIFRNGPVPILTVTTQNYSRSQNIRISKIDNLGKTDYIVTSDGPANVSNPYTPYYLYMDSIGIQQTGNIGLVTPTMGALSSGSAATVWIQARNISNGGTIAGNPIQLVNRLITDCNSADASGYKTLLAGGFHIKQNTTNAQLKLERTGTTAGSSEVFANATGLNTSTTFCLPNAAWDNSLFRLASYRLWVDSFGRLRIKNSSDPTSDTDGTVVGTQT